MSILQEAQAILPEIVGWRRYFHQHPELGMDLPVTAAKVKEVLDSLGVRYREIIPCGILAYIGKEGGKSILLRGDMDALPLEEQTGLPYCSQTPGRMHACGHDTHTAMLLGAAKLLKQHESELNGLAILMFQPGEEVLAGAKAMVDAGALQDPKPDGAMALHIASSPLKTGQIAMGYGPCAASSDCYKITLHGKGGHGSAPQDSINPIFCACKIIEAFTDIARFEIDPQQPSVVNTCSIHSGTIYNIIPEDCEIMGTVRMFNEEQRARVLGRMQEAVEKIASLYRCTAQWSLDLSVPCTVSDEAFSQQLHDLLVRDLDGVEVLPLSHQKMMGSEDFAWVSQNVPSCAMQVGSTAPQGQDYPAHHPKVVFDENCFPYGTATYVQAALSFLK